MLFIKKIQAQYQVVADPEDIKEGFRDEMKKIVDELDSLHDGIKYEDSAYCKDFREMEPQHPVFDLLRDFEKKLDIALSQGNKIIDSLD